MAEPVKRLVFMGTGPFALEPLRALWEAFGDRIEISVYTKAPKPQGRGMKTSPGCVEAFAREKGLALHQPKTLRSEEAEAEFRAIGADLGVVASYGLILPSYALRTPPFGYVNLHASLLPRLRGAAPINRAVMDGEAESGVTLMQMDEGLDTGDILRQCAVPLEAQETAGSLFDKLALLAAKMIVEALPLLEARAFTPQKQNDALSTYAAKIEAEDQKLSFEESAEALDRRIRGLTPVPGAFALRERDGKRIRIHEAAPVKGGGEPGEVISLKPLTVACGEGALEILSLQPEGKAKMTAKDAVNGRALVLGDRLL